MQEDRAFVVGGFVELIVERHGRDHPRERLNHQHPDSSADKRQYQRFEQELHQDMPRARSDRLTQADLARSLRNGHQHDIHHADATYGQRAYADQP